MNPDCQVHFMARPKAFDPRTTDAPAVRVIRRRGQSDSLLGGLAAVDGGLMEPRVVG